MSRGVVQWGGRGPRDPAEGARVLQTCWLQSSADLVFSLPLLAVTTNALGDTEGPLPTLGPSVPSVKWVNNLSTISLAS